MKQIILIHGGTPFNTYEDYVNYLETKPVRFERYRMKDWKETLGERLGTEYDVIAPVMPCKDNAKYSEWKIWFERLIPSFENEVILIGHSLGGMFLVKWLSENKYPKKIKAVLLVATPYGLTGESQEACDFGLPKDLQGLQDQAGNICIYQSEDDPIVPAAEARKYKELIPDAELIMFKDHKHFNGREFPEIVAKIKEIF